MRVAIDERRFWLVGAIPAEDLDALALMSLGFSEEDATTIVYEVQSYDPEAKIPILVSWERPEFIVPLQPRRRGPTVSIRLAVPCSDGIERMATFSGPDEAHVYIAYYRYLRRLMHEIEEKRAN